MVGGNLCTMISVVSSEDEHLDWERSDFFLKRWARCHSGIAWFGKRYIYEDVFSW
jgi:hypothetical protein